MKRITVEWSDRSSIENAIDELVEYNKSLENYRKRFCLKLAEIGRDYAQNLYDNDFAIGDQHSGVMCSVEATQDGAKILANGDTVCFVEFGSGSFADGSEHEGMTFSPSSWSSSELGKHMLANLGYWVWEDKVYFGIPPLHAMTRTIAEMEARVGEVAQQLKGELT